MMPTPVRDPNNLRRDLHSGYTLVRSLENNKAVASLTLDHLLQEHINSLKPEEGITRQILDGKGEAMSGQERLSRYDMLNQIKTLFDGAVGAIASAGDDPDKLVAIGLVEANGITDSANPAVTDALKKAIQKESKKGV